jgi:fructose-1,6-bisphosphatase/inositol monophosphatase family enzyme
MGVSEIGVRCGREELGVAHTCKRVNAPAAGATDMSEPISALLDALLGPAERRAAQGPGRVQVKPDGSRVSDADLDVDALIAEGLQRRFPGDGLCSEEGARRPGPAWWAVDPIDGTENFLRGRPDWGHALCRVVEGRPALTLLSFPAHGERWWAIAGGGAHRAGRPLPRLSPPGAAAAPLPAPADPDGRPVLLPDSVRRHIPAVWPGPALALRCTTRALALVAAGEAGAALVGAGWGPWDLLPGLLVLHEVGAGAWTIDGAPLDPAEALGPTFAEPLVVGAPGPAAALAAALRAAG